MEITRRNLIISSLLTFGSLSFRGFRKDFSYTDEFVRLARQGPIFNKTFKLDKTLVMEKGWDIRMCTFECTENFRGDCVVTIPYKCNVIGNLFDASKINQRQIGISLKIS